MGYQHFFEENEDYYITTHFYENTRSCTVEDLYQAFKERLKAELKIEESELLDD